MIELDENLPAVYDGTRADVTPDDFRCLHAWKQIVTTDGVFTNIGSAVIWRSSSIDVRETPHVARDKRFHNAANRTEVSGSWLP